MVEQSIKQHMGPGYAEPVHLKENPANGIHREGIQHLKVGLLFNPLELYIFIKLMSTHAYFRISIGV